MQFQVYLVGVQRELSLIIFVEKVRTIRTDVFISIETRRLSLFIRVRGTRVLRFFARFNTHTNREYCIAANESPGRCARKLIARL